MRTLLLTLLLTTLAMRTAFADDAVSFVVSAEPSVDAEVTQQVDRWLRDHGHTPSRVTLTPSVNTAVRSCFDRTDDKCARAALAKSVTAPTLVFAKVELRPGSEGTRNMMLTAYWLAEGHEAVADQRYCERCTAQLLRQSIDELMSSLTTAGQHTTGYLTLTSEPPGAKVLVDGTAIGATPLSYDLAPGNHQITLTAPGHDVETRQITVRDGETTRLAVPLVASGSVKPPVTPPAAHASRALPIALLAGGAALAITGGVLIAIDEDESPSGPLQIRDTAPTGVALAIGGGAIAVVGAVLLLRTGHRDSASGPIATVTSSAGYFGWAGSF